MYGNVVQNVLQSYTVITRVGELFDRDEIEIERLAMYSLYKRQRIIFYHNQVYKSPAWDVRRRLLHAEGLAASRRGISKFIAKYRETGSIGRRPGSGRPSKITAEVKEIVEEQMQTDDETSAHQLH